MKQRRLRWLMGWLLLAVAMLMPQYGGAWAATYVTSSKPALGDGSSSNPFQISNAKELAWFRDWVNGTYTASGNETATTHPDACAKLTANIDMSTVCGESIGSWSPIGTSKDPWNGCFDGNSKTISNLYINASTRFQGLFGRIKNEEKTSFIKDIYFKDVNVYNSEADTGILAGNAYGVNISGIHVESGSVKSTDNYIGGILGYSYLVNISNCTNHSNVSSYGWECGGIIGMLNIGTIEKCINYGTVESTAYFVGGIIGECRDASLANCASLASVKGGYYVGGIVGRIEAEKAQPTIQNVFSYGDVEATRDKYVGMIAGIAEQATLGGHLIYNTDATFKSYNKTQAMLAFGNTPFGENLSTGMSQEVIKSGYAAYLLQKGAGEDGVWEQQIGTGEYPLLGSEHTIYADNVIMNCTGSISQGNFTNEKPSTTSDIIINHGDATFHPAVAHTCFSDGSVAYYQCSACNKQYGDKLLTQLLPSIVDPSIGHEYENETCTLCQKKIPTLATGVHTLQIEKVFIDASYPGSYNLYKFIAPYNGTLTISTSSEWETFGTVWNDGLTKKLCSDDPLNTSNYPNPTCEVEVGKTYYIGVRTSRGYAIEDEDEDYQLTIKLNNELKNGDQALVGFLNGENIIGTKQDDDYIVENLEIVDGKQISLCADNVKLESGSYSRSFAHDKWQALYVPFETKVTEELLNDFDLAAPNNLHEYELADGTTKVVLEAKKMKSGYTIKALRPYLIRAKEAGEKSIQLTDCPMKGAVEDSYVDCSSVLRHYKFIGTLKGKTSFDTTADFVLSEGKFLGSKADTQLKAMRWYLNATDRDTDMGILPDSGNAGIGGGSGSTQASRSIDISIVDDDATTGIDDISVITEQASGSASASRRGIYDLQGRKLSQEPLSGVYIKDGKKMVK